MSSGKKADIVISDLNKIKIKLKFYDDIVRIFGDAIDAERKTELPLNQFVRLGSDITIGWVRDFGPSETQLKLKYGDVVRCGRATDNTVILHAPMISNHHLIIRHVADGIHVEDLKSTNGVYLNGKRIEKSIVKTGDCIDLVDVRIRVVNSELYFENVEKIEINPTSDKGGNTPYYEGNRPIYRISARVREMLPNAEIVLSKPPMRHNAGVARRGSLSRLISSGAMIGSMFAMGTVSPALLVARSAYLVPSVTNAFGGGKKEKKKLKKYEQARLELYTSYIQEQKSRIEAIADKQREIIIKENPLPQRWITVARERDISLWERRKGDSDFLSIRLGDGYEDLCVPVRIPQDNSVMQMDEDDLQELSKLIVEETQIVDHVPARVDLLHYNRIGIVGKRVHEINLLKKMLISLTAAHFYEDVHIVGVFDQEETVWRSLRWLPHIWDEERQVRFLSFEESDSDEMERFCDILKSILQQRKAEANDKVRATPHYIFILGSQKKAERLSIMRDLLNCSPQMGITTLFLYDQIGYIPSDCQFIITTDDETFQGCGAGYDVNAVNKKFCFTMDPDISDQEFDAYCRSLAAVEVEGLATRAEMPMSVTFLQGMGVKTVTELDAWNRWTSHQPGKTFPVPIGAMAGNKTFYLDVDQKGSSGDGCNGLIAGTVGSGKSELLTTWILSMAVNYHPQDVAFVVIDYKGGGLSNSLAGLPHVIGTITNLDQNIDRPLKSLRSEITRRQQILGDAGLTEFHDYQKAFYNGQVQNAFPFIFVVSDEFAELKQEKPEFIKTLISIARLGRALGVRLVLATQTPELAVSEDIKAVSNWAACLKVKDASNSKAMIDRPDAARLTQVGRAYVKIGTERFEQIQSFWAGAPYNGGKDDSAVNQVRVVTMHGDRINPVQIEKTHSAKDRDELQAISAYLRTVATQHNVPKIPAPWKPEIPHPLYLQRMDISGGFDGKEWSGRLPWLQIPVGIYDIPENQEQDVQYVDLESGKHFAIYGAPGTGKTTLLKTLIVSICSWYTPEDIVLYILDLNSHSLSLFEHFPHVGCVALDYESERFSKLHDLLEKMINERKSIFSKHGVSSLKSYREIISTDIPAIVVMVDGIIPLLDSYPDYESLLIQISREGANFGIYLIFTANNTTGIKMKITTNISSVIAFEMTDKGDFISTVGRPTDSLTCLPGRAFIKSKPYPIEFQAAMYIEGRNEKEQYYALKHLMDAMNGAWKGKKPEGIAVIPEKITAETLMGCYQKRTVIPIGYSFKTVEPIFLELETVTSALIVGDPGCGKSEFLLTLVQMIKWKCPDFRSYVFDSTRRGLLSLKTEANFYAVSNDPKATNQLATQLCTELDQRVTDLNNRKKASATHDFDTKLWEASLPLICVVIDDLDDFVRNAPDEVSAKVEIAARNGHGLGVIIFAAGRKSDLTTLSAQGEILTKTMLSNRKKEQVQNQRGILLSGSAAQFPAFISNLAISKKGEQLKSGEAMLFHGGSCQKLKRILKEN